METTNNANLDLFIQLARGINKYNLITLLNNSWDKNKLKTMAIIFNSRDRLKGKKEKEISNNCLLWLKDNHLSIYKKNIITYIDKYGCWNDLNYIIKKDRNNKFEYKLFASQLKKDKEDLEENKNISLCAKWVINANTKYTIKIARYLFEDIRNYHERYRKEYLIPLRKKLDLLESKLCNKDYENINYSKLPAKALALNKKTFIKYDNEKYSAFLKDVSENKQTLKITGLLPHEIINKYMKNLNEIDETLELQWKTIIDNYNYNNNTNEDIIPIVDVSGSMYQKINNIEPIYVSIALGLLLSQINKGFFHNKIITFSESPIFFTIEGETLKDKIRSIIRSAFGLNTNFLRIADLIISNNIPCKKIICFTDMQFDEGQSHNLFIQKFKDNNLDVPQLIYWNLTGKYNNYPINNNNDDNTSIISGYSEQLLSVVLQIIEKQNITPELLMEKILEPYYDSIIL